jgi:O-antigen ligase
MCLISLVIGNFLDINKSLSYGRANNLFGEEEIMGSYVVRILPLIIGISFLLDMPKRNFINLAILLIAGSLIIISGERTAFGYFFFLLAFYFFINRKQILFFIVIFFTITLILYNYNSNSITRIFTLTISQQKNSGHILSFRHEAHILTAHNMFLEKKLFGHGLKSFRNLCDQEQYNTYLNERKFSYIKKNPLIPLPDDISQVVNGCSTHPHNIYFQFLSEIGLIGFMLFFIFFFFICFKLYNFFKDFLNNKIQCSNNYIASSFFLFAIFTSMFPIFPSGNYFNNWLLIINALPLGFYLSIIKKK